MTKLTKIILFLIDRKYENSKRSIVEISQRVHLEVINLNLFFIRFMHDNNNQFYLIVFDLEVMLLT